MKIQTYILALTLLLVTSCEGDFTPTGMEGRWYRFNVLGKRKAVKLLAELQKLWLNNGETSLKARM